MTDDNEADNAHEHDEDCECGAPEGNQNALKHGLYSDRDNLYKNLDEEQQRFVVQLSEDLLDRVEGEIGAYEREAIRNICIDVVKRRKFNEYFAENDFDVDNVAEKTHRIYKDLVKLTTSELTDLGLNMQAPEQKEAEAKQGWFSAFEDDE